MDFQPQNILTAIFSISIYVVFINLSVCKLPKLFSVIAQNSPDIYFLHRLVICVIDIVLEPFLKNVLNSCEVLIVCIIGEKVVVGICILVQNMKVICADRMQNNLNIFSRSD